MVNVTDSMTNSRNLIFWVGVKLDFVPECTVNPSVFPALIKGGVHIDTVIQE